MPPAENGRRPVRTVLLERSTHTRTRSAVPAGKKDIVRSISNKQIIAVEIWQKTRRTPLDVAAAGLPHMYVDHVESITLEACTRRCRAMTRTYSCSELGLRANRIPTDWYQSEPQFQYNKLTPETWKFQKLDGSILSFYCPNFKFLASVIGWELTIRGNPICAEPYSEHRKITARRESKLSKTTLIAFLGKTAEHSAMVCCIAQEVDIQPVSDRDLGWGQP